MRVQTLRQILSAHFSGQSQRWELWKVAEKQAKTYKKIDKRFCLRFQRTDCFRSLQDCSNASECCLESLQQLVEDCYGKMLDGCHFDQSVRDAVWLVRRLDVAAGVAYVRWLFPALWRSCGRKVRKCLNLFRTPWTSMDNDMQWIALACSAGTGWIYTRIIYIYTCLGNPFSVMLLYSSICYCIYIYM